MTIRTLQDIFNSEHEGLLDNISPDILVPRKSNEEAIKKESRSVAERTRCKDFDEFKPVFKKVSEAFESKRFSKINHISEKSVSQGGVYVLNGQLCYVADIYLDKERKEGDYNKRLRLIYANGTESNMLVHSMTIIQYKYGNSYQIVLHDDEEVAGENDAPCGVIYAARMRVKPSEFASYNTPHKIGFTIHTGAQRSKNSTKDTAFLQREVDIVSEWEAFGVDPHRIERLIHAFFASRHIKATITGSDGKQYKANEWFDVPLHSIARAVELILQGEAKNYKVSEVTGEIVPK